MQPIYLSLVLGKRGSGISTLLQAFAARADMQAVTIIDEGKTNDGLPLPEAWGADDIEGWLQQLRISHDQGNAASAGRIVLAASDLKAPRHILQALAADPVLNKTFRLDAVTVAVASPAAGSGAADATCSEQHLLNDQQLRRAATIADRIVLTYTDQAEPAAVKRLASTLKSLNPPAPILHAPHGDIGPARLVDSGLFDPITSSIDIDRWLCEPAFNFEAARRGGLHLPQSPLGQLSNEIGVRFFAITLDQPIDGTMLSVFLKLLMADRGADLLRLKGIIATDDHPDRPALIDGREHIIQPLLWLPAWPTADHRSRLVFVTSDFSETWVRTLLSTLNDQLCLAEEPKLQLARLVV